jgi:hypothetical protein
MMQNQSSDHSELFVFPLSDHLDPVWNASQ